MRSSYDIKHISYVYSTSQNKIQLIKYIEQLGRDEKPTNLPRTPMPYVEYYDGRESKNVCSVIKTKYCCDI